ncbi:MAG: hypothetical protein K9J16_08295 [Melioribacteraceae bacterium]|nr:hypothetical protein [Melioribacteraceae bacterium]MCF8353176.1 hypothetical protein [Melioribacteraceae bacterium]MCF8395160.1 hypothetical protein [Melioribacteraceae bacterium]MCF8418027.1 hypothetical protein [Melioribacteraceae bacterium]
MSQTINMPKSYPKLKYVSHGYIDNPYHSAVLNRSGIIRSVPPIGFGFWARRLPWSYAEGALRNVNYLSFLHLSINIDDIVLHELHDFHQNKIELYSSYHTKNMMSYNFTFRGIEFDIKYYLINENSLMGVADIENISSVKHEITLHATNIYGFVERNWWGSGGILGNYDQENDALVNKIWSYGDVFILGSDKKSKSHNITFDENKWSEAVRTNYLQSTENKGEITDKAVYNTISFNINANPGQSERLTLSLTRGVNQIAALKEFKSSLTDSADQLNKKLNEDEKFYNNMPMLTGDWSDFWKQGWVYDFETLRMTIRQPAGIYEHHWDGMQIFTPRSVLGESALDMMCYSFADIEMAKEVILGTFADAPAPNVPCSREDGSMNMIGESGEECGTAPTWGIPFHVIQSIYLRDGDDEWIKKLYPYLKSFLQWWLKNRTDTDGWFFCDNSWESGQDGSKRFLIGENEEGKSATYVRTVDVEAVMANAFHNMIEFSKIAGADNDTEYWKELADDRINRTRKMFVDGWFRDFDSRTEKPIILKDYFDIMMLLPVSVKVAEEKQVEAIKPMIKYFVENPKYWLDWPSFMFPYTEAVWNAGMLNLNSELIYKTGNRIYKRSSDNNLKPVGVRNVGLPEKYNYRIPGVATEFWPEEMDKRMLNGCENYGWGATLPALVIRNIIGYRESIDASNNKFILAPSLPNDFYEQPGSYGISKIKFREFQFSIEYLTSESGGISVKLKFETQFNNIIISCNGEKIDSLINENEISFGAVNNTVYEIQLK